MQSYESELVWHSRITWDGSCSEILISSSIANNYEATTANNIAIAVAQLRSALEGMPSL